MTGKKLSKFLNDLEKRVLECSICFEKLQQPKSLPCQHSFCIQCLEDWVKAKGELACPTCSKSYPIPDGGLQNIPPNTFVNNLLETIKQTEEREKSECNCKTGKKTTYYCQECREYICSACYDHHKRFPALTDHIIHSIEDVKSMTPLEFSSLHRQPCVTHNEPLDFYCKCCETAICMNCAITDHSVGDGNHKLISISEAFNDFKKTAIKMMKIADQYTTTAEVSLTKIFLNAVKIDDNKDTCLKDIENHVQEMVQIIKNTGEQLKEKVKRNYENKKRENDAQIHEISIPISDVANKLNFLSQLLKSDEAIAMQSSRTIITSLEEKLKQLSKTMNIESNADNEEIIFFKNKQQITELKKYGIGNVSEKKIADCLRFKGERKVFATQCQTVTVKIVKTDKCKIPVNELNAKLTKGTEATALTHVQEENDGNYAVKVVCTSIGVYTLDVSIGGEPIIHSPMTINIQREGLVNTIKVGKMVADVVWCEGNYCLLVSFQKEEILKYRQTGEYIGSIKLPKGVCVNRMYKMKNGNLAFSDNGVDQCIRICTTKGQLISTIGKRVMGGLFGIVVNESSTDIYATSFDSIFMYSFNIDNNEVAKRMNFIFKGYNDITFTRDGNFLLSNQSKSIIEFWDGEQFRKVLIWPGDDNGRVSKPGGIVVDNDGKIIVSSINKLQLFGSDGAFIKRIDKEEDEINSPQGLTIISYYPRRVAVTNHQSVKIYDY